MRRLSVVPVLLAACIASSVAVAAKESVTATFESLAASGISGQAVLKAVPTGGTQIHAQLRGLEPSTEYIVSMFSDNKTCASGSASQEVTRITANPAGIANFHEKVSTEIAGIGSLSIQRGSDQSLQACAAVTP